MLAWRAHVDRRQHTAAVVRVEVHASAVRALGGDSVLGIRVTAPTLWRRGAVLVSSPGDCELVLGQAFGRMLQRVPSGYEVVMAEADVEMARIAGAVTQRLNGGLRASGRPGRRPAPRSHRRDPSQHVAGEVGMLRPAPP